MEEGRLVEAEKAWKGGIAYHTEKEGPNAESTLDCKAYWATTLGSLGRCQEAKKLWEVLTP